MSENLKKPRGNPDKLIPQSKRTKREQSEIAQKGGRASGKARAARKTLREELTALLEGANDNGKTLQESLTAALLQQALKGNVKAFEVIRDTIGEKPVDKVDVAMSNQESIQEVKEMLDALKRE